MCSSCSSCVIGQEEDVHSRAKKGRNHSLHFKDGGSYLIRRRETKRMKGSAGESSVSPNVPSLQYLAHVNGNIIIFRPSHYTAAVVRATSSVVYNDVMCQSWRLRRSPRTSLSLTSNVTPPSADKPSITGGAKKDCKWRYSGLESPQ